MKVKITLYNKNIFLIKVLNRVFMKKVLYRTTAFIFAAVATLALSGCMTNRMESDEFFLDLVSNSDSTQAMRALRNATQASLVEARKKNGYFENHVMTIQPNGTRQCVKYNFYDLTGKKPSELISNGRGNPTTTSCPEHN